VGSGAGGRPQGAHTTSRRALKNWRVRSRLLLLITIPTLTAVVLGGTYIASSVQNALVYQRVETLANLSGAVTGLAAHLEDERDQAMEFIGQGQAGRAGLLIHDHSDGAPQNLALVRQEQSLTALWVRKVQTESAAVGAGYSAQVQQDAENIGHVLQLLDPLRTAATTTELPAVDVMSSYTSIIDGLLAIDNNIAGDSGDPQLTSDVRSLNLVSLIGEEASEQRGLLAYALAQDTKFDPVVLADLQTALAEQNANVAEFDRVATAQQVALYQNKVQGSLVDFASNYELQAITYGQEGVSLSTLATTANQWYGAMSTGTIVDGIRNVEQNLVGATTSRAAALHRSAIITASLIGGAVLVVLLLALLLTTIVGRTMVRPLRRLRSGALEVAGVRLPETVRRMSESDGSSVPLEVEPIDVDSFDEIGEVARAFDQVHREALRLAANEAALRGNVNAMFVNLSRRSQSLVERQIRLIDDLEQGEQEPDRLASLFQMDHLATRMRRNSENLLVLAGHEATRRWNQPVSLVDVLRAAVSEIEQYERVRLNVQPGIAVRGHAVNDVVHLLAELAENATSFSSAETPVAVAGHLLSSGGVLLDITDQGVGMGAEEMAHANWRLDNPPVVDVAVSRRMGLFVVARLAARHGIRVRLRPAAAGGLTALVWLPDEVISHQADASPPGTRRFELPGTGAVAGASPAVALTAGRNGIGDGLLSPAEREINAARMPRFSDLQAESGELGSGEFAVPPDRETGLGPHRVPGAGLHPGMTGREGPASTSPLPAFGSPEAEASLAAAAEHAEVVRDTPAESDAFGGATRTAEPADRLAATASAAVSARPAPLGPPSVVGPQSASASESARALESPAGSYGLLRSAPLDISSPGGVIVPAAEHVATENRLPIFEAVESDWFRRGRSGVPAGGVPAGSAPAGSAPASGGRVGSTALDGGSGRWPVVQPAPDLASEAPSEPAPEPDVSWRSSAADQGWEAAAAAISPTTGGTTDAGLPKRVPQANLVPGAAPPEAVAPVPARSAAVTRDRFASFQRGVREGRAAVSREDESSDVDGGS
ncbi:MAG: nitrate- and nitrite sensing domain-containing protein, partial [Streptosporangiaceae bacterium]